jgi:hypothetical protein
MDYIIQIAAWSFLPNIGAGVLQSIVYMIGLKSREQEGTICLWEMAARRESRQPENYLFHTEHTEKCVYFKVNKSRIYFVENGS